jgi:hypothetical protein
MSDSLRAFINGTATITREPTLLERLAAHGCMLADQIADAELTPEESRRRELSHAPVLIVFE